jgi:hypothetical protein
MSVNCKNQHIAAFKLAGKAGRASQKGGVRYGVNNSTLSKTANLGMGRGYPMSNTTSTCGGKANPSNLGAAIIRGGGKPYSEFNNLRSSAYGFTSKGAAMAKTFRGSYAAPSEIRRSQCGGKRRKSRKRKSRRRKSRRTKKRKSRRKRTRRRKSRRRKSKRRRTKRRKSRRKRQRGGNKWSQAGSNKALSYRYSTPAKVNMPWALGPHSRTVTPITN